MPITRSYGNAFELVDYTQELTLVPNKWTLLNDVGLFTPESLFTTTATFEAEEGTLALIGDRHRGAKPSAMKGDVRKIHSYAIPHFPTVDALTGEDLFGKRAYGSVSSQETEAQAVAKKIAKIARAYDDTWEIARFKTLTTLQAYAPNGTVAANFATDFGITQKSVTFDLTTATTDVVAKVEEVIAHIQDNAKGTSLTGVVCYASPEFFASLINHAKVQTAYQYFTATEGQMIQRNRAGGNNMSMYREFNYGGVRFIEVRGSAPDGTRFVPANEAVFIPTGTNGVFMTYFAPSNKLDLIGTIAEPRYLWTYRDPKGDKIEIEASSDFLNIVRQPALVVKGLRA